MTPEAIAIYLPSLIHRIGRDAVKQAQRLAEQYSCELKRIRRSRNWTVSGEAIDIQSFTAALNTENVEAFRYLTQKLTTALLQHADKLEPLDVKLVRLVTANPNLTLSALIELTNCSMSEARQARSHADAW